MSGHYQHDLRLFSFATLSNNWTPLIFVLFRKILELEEELKVVGNNMKSLEVSEQEVQFLLCEENSLSNIFFRQFNVKKVTKNKFVI